MHRSIIRRLAGFRLAEMLRWRAIWHDSRLRRCLTSCWRRYVCGRGRYRFFNTTEFKGAELFGVPCILPWDVENRAGLLSGTQRSSRNLRLIWFRHFQFRLPVWQSEEMVPASSPLNSRYCWRIRDPTQNININFSFINQKYFTILLNFCFVEPF
jgi:hypothetical protein